MDCLVVCGTCAVGVDGIGGGIVGVKTLDLVDVKAGGITDAAAVVVRLRTTGGKGNLVTSEKVGRGMTVEVGCKVTVGSEIAVAVGTSVGCLVGNGAVAGSTTKVSVGVGDGCTIVLQDSVTNRTATSRMLFEKRGI